MSQESHAPPRSMISPLDPPSYEAAIGRPLLHTPSAPELLSAPTHNLKPQDIASGLLDSEDEGDIEERDYEEEQDYEDSRPLKMGQIPSTRAQYTFIQPYDTINKGTNSSNNQVPHPEMPYYLQLPNRHSGIPAQHTMQYSPPSHCPPTPSAPPQTLHQSEQQCETCPSKPITAVQPIQSYNSTASASYGPPPFSPPTGPNPVAPAGVPDTPRLINSQDVSIADFKRKTQGVESCDKILEDPYQLYRFFVAHSDRPTMSVIIRGHHTENRHTVETSSDGKSNSVTRTQIVEDFKIEIDLTPYISSRGTLYVAPDPKTGKCYTLREVMEQYADEENQFKEIHMQKNVQWDYDELTKAITHAIRSVNYRYTIDISFPCTNNVVIVKSASPIANCMRSGWTKAFCCLTMVGIIFYPARAAYRKIKNKTLKSEFQMNISTRDFYMHNYWTIVDQVQYK
ncbi:hypothetical protein BGZ76_011391 [Entomortierella beljakovae]|nr:hypothetical protein BGZ76_011391 [Entomortierella beljakovae]